MNVIPPGRNVPLPDRANTLRGTGSNDVPGFKRHVRKNMKLVFESCLISLFTQTK